MTDEDILLRLDHLVEAMSSFRDEALSLITKERNDREDDVAAIHSDLRDLGTSVQYLRLAIRE